MIEFRPNSSDRFGEVSVEAEQDGSFKIRIPSRAEGSIQASDHFYESSHPDCPRIIELLKSTDSAKLRTSTAALPARSAITDLVLRFPFDFCAEKKR